jgi:peptidoglycan hydrolase-like protein with peptidoglycan-binding domain
MPGGFVSERLGWTPRDIVGLVVCVLASAAILINLLFMQSQPHPAPMFKAAVAAAKPKLTNDANAAGAPVQSRRVESPSVPARTPMPPPRTPGQIINDIQRELSRRGYYEGTIDGLYGPKTDAAIRDFEHAYGLKPSTEPSEALLQSILRSPNNKAAKGVTGTTSPRPVARSEDVADRSPPSTRMIAVQRALAEYGYGQIKPSGIADADTQRAIEKFERERKLPVTGQLSDGLLRELAAMTGRPLE